MFPTNVPPANVLCGKVADAAVIVDPTTAKLLAELPNWTELPLLIKAALSKYPYLFVPVTNAN